MDVNNTGFKMFFEKGMQQCILMRNTECKLVKLHRASVRYLLIQRLSSQPLLVQVGDSGDKCGDVRVIIKSTRREVKTVLQVRHQAEVSLIFTSRTRGLPCLKWASPYFLFSQTSPCFAHSEPQRLYLYLVYIYRDTDIIIRQNAVNISQQSTSSRFQYLPPLICFISLWGDFFGFNFWPYDR